MTWTRSHPEVGPPDTDDHNHDDHDGDSDVEVHLPLAFLLTAETQTRDIVRHVGPRLPNLTCRIKDYGVRSRVYVIPHGETDLGEPVMFRPPTSGSGGLCTVLSIGRRNRRDTCHPYPGSPSSGSSSFAGPMAASNSRTWRARMSFR